MERISDKKIAKIHRDWVYDHTNTTSVGTLEQAVAQAQLEACQQEHERVVREIFIAIESFNLTIAHFDMSGKSYTEYPFRYSQEMQDLESKYIEGK